MIERELVNKLALEESKKYQNLDLFGLRVSIPYYMNISEGDWSEGLNLAKVDIEKIKSASRRFENKETYFGRFKGKGTRDQIRESSLELCSGFGFPNKNTTAGGVSVFLSHLGLGIDCSGLVFNILDQAIKNAGGRGLAELVDRSGLNVYKFSCQVFGELEGGEITGNDIQELDLVLIKNNQEKYKHIGIFLKENNKLSVHQSTITMVPSGVRSDVVGLTSDGIDFDFCQTAGDDWNELKKNGKLVIKRLKVFYEKS